MSTETIVSMAKINTIINMYLNFNTMNISELPTVIRLHLKIGIVKKHPMIGKHRRKFLVVVLSNTVGDNIIIGFGYHKRNNEKDIYIS